MKIMKGMNSNANKPQHIIRKLRILFMLSCEKFSVSSDISDSYKTILSYFWQAEYKYDANRSGKNIKQEYEAGKQSDSHDFN
jgi:hypothetical protein